MAGAGPAVAGIELLWLVLVLDQHGCLRGCWSGAAGRGRPGGAAARAGSDLVVPVRKAPRSWHPVPVPTSGPAGKAAGQAPPVGVAMKLGDPRHRQLVAVHLDSHAVGVPGQHATRRPPAGHHPKVPMRGEDLHLPWMPWWYPNVLSLRPYNGRAGNAASPDGASVSSPLVESRMGPPLQAAAERDVLLATKLHVPQPRPGFLARPRLLQQLAEGTARGLVLACAPAGFGKTALLGDWARCSQRAVAWLSLDPDDNDPARFWRHVLAALEGVRPGVAEQLAPLLGPPAPPSFEGLVTALINELAAVTDEMVLVLDDYHLVDAEPVHGSLAFLVEHRPPGLRLVLAGRTDPPLPLARLRVRGQLAELRTAELRFTPEEAAAVLREVVGPDLPEEAVAALAARTEGWAAGLQLAALSL